MKIVSDTNIFVSSFLSPGGAPRSIINLWKTGRVILCLCAEIIEEYAEVLGRFGLAGEVELKELLTLFRSRQFIDFVAIDGNMRVIVDDPADDKFIECALKTHATCILSEDKHLLALKSYSGVRILKPAEFLMELGEG